MNEEEARAWVAREYDVPRETMERLDGFAALLREENGRQNLVSAPTLEQVWSRHIADSAQLLRFAPAAATWIDLGTGAGFPGLVAALLHDGPITLVEERRRRAEFLHRAAAVLGLRVDILQCRVEGLQPRQYGVISARAFAPLAKTLNLATGLSTTNSVWILPKGRNAATELAALDASWQGEFRLEPSVTDPDARIVVATGVHRLAGRRVKGQRR